MLAGNWGLKNGQETIKLENVNMLDLSATQATQIRWDEPAALVVVIVTSIGLATSLGFAGFVFFFRDHSVIKRASPVFCSLMVSILFFN